MWDVGAHARDELDCEGARRNPVEGCLGCFFQLQTTAGSVFNAVNASITLQVEATVLTIPAVTESQGGELNNVTAGPDLEPRWHLSRIFVTSTRRPGPERCR